MPIVERDPWRNQYFEKVDCPDDVLISTDDPDSYVWYPKHRWIYNKLWIAESQGLPHGPHGVEPDTFPVFSKPIYNMKGMGSGSKILTSLKEYRQHNRPGHMWMPLLGGEHVSSDVAVVSGEPRWWRHCIGKPLDGGMFDYWKVLAESNPGIEEYCGDWIRAHLSDYTGMLNFETIGTRIIEAHLRFADQWPDLYGAGWCNALVNLYKNQEWEYPDDARRDGYSVVLFGAHGIQYRHPSSELLAELGSTRNVSSIQVTFHEDRSPQSHAMPPGGFRLAIVNSWDLETAFAVRQQLALSFWSTQRLLQKRGRKSSRPSDAASDQGPVT